jgi:hypothetical protein
MPMTPDFLTQELRRLDPVGPEELSGALEAPAAVEMLERILALELDPVDHPLHPDHRPRRRVAVGRSWWRRRTARLALAALALAAVAVLVALLTSSGGGGGGEGAGALEAAAAAAGSRPAAAADLPFTYLRTREVAIDTAGADGRSWSVYEPTTREEWVARDGSGRLRVITGPSRFVGPGDRAEWEAAGSPSFLALGFGRRTEDRWLAGGLGRRNVEELPAEPAALATRLRYEAEVEHGALSVPAATLGLIAEDLDEPSASPALRRALFGAAKLVPGIEYLGGEADPEGRHGVAIGVTSPGGGPPARYSLIFDPATSKVLATETTSLAHAGPGAAAPPTLVRARAFLAAHGVASKKEFAKTWLGGFEPEDASAESLAAFLVYRVPAEEHSGRG